VGRLIRGSEKVNLLIERFGLLQTEVPDIEAMVIGKGPEGREFKRIPH